MPSLPSWDTNALQLCVDAVQQGVEVQSLVVYVNLEAAPDKELTDVENTASVSRFCRAMFSEMLQSWRTGRRH